MSRRYVSTGSWAANWSSRPSFLMLVVLVLGLATRTAAVGQACSYYGTSGGTCKSTSSCFGAYGPTLSGKTTGCQTDPDPDIQCCLVKSCSASEGTGTCRKTGECFGTTVTSSNGATGCQAFPADTTCCITTPAATPRPTPAATPRPTPAATPRPTPPSGPISCTDGRGGSGTCQTTAACSSGVSTTTANGANGCQSAGSNVFCCTYPSCSAQGVSGTCSDTSKSCFYSRVSSSNGASGCNSYPSTVNCCLDGPLPNNTPAPTPFNPVPTPFPTPQPGPITPSPVSGISQVGNPCMAKGVSGTCQFPSSCTGLATLPADGASGCLGSEVMCCTSVTCVWIDPFGQKETTNGQCRHSINQSPCPTVTQTSSLGATGCNLYNNNIVCCLDQLPVPKAMPRTPMPSPAGPPATPAPTPFIPPAPSSTCQYMGDEGMCVAEPSCVGIGVRAGEGASGCAFSTDVSVVCCMQRPCTVTDQVNGEREGLCRSTRRCQQDGQASYQPSDGASGCEVFGAGNNCCSEPVAPPPGATVAPTQPPANNGFTETTCSVQTDNGRREGTCYEPENCEAEFHPPGEAGFMGCRNAAQFANRGCCVVRQTSPAPTGACTPGDPKTCPLGEQCQMVGSAPTCIVDRNFDCKAAGGCVVGGQECAPDGPNGAYVCGAARTCRVVPCQRGDAMCIADSRGFAQCVVAGDCFQNTCSFDQECRPDPRGTRFPSVCAQKQVRNTPSPSSSNGSGMPDWLIGVIAGACILVCLILICIVVAVVVALRNRNDIDYSDASFNNATPMMPMTVQNAAFSGSYGSGQYGTNGNYPVAMGAGSNSMMYPSGMAGQSHGGTMMTGYGSTASELGRGGFNAAYPSSGGFNGGGAMGYGAAGGGSVGYGGNSAGGYGAGGEVYPSFRTPPGSVGYSPSSRPAF